MNGINARPSFDPLDENYREKVEDSFSRQKAMATLGITLAGIQPGEVVLEFPYQPELSQQHGFIHAGVLSTAMDSACGYAAFSLMPRDAAVLTIEFKVNLMSPAKGDGFTVVGRVIKPGRTVTVCQGDAYALEGGAHKHIAKMTGTLMAVYDRPGIHQ